VLKLNLGSGQNPEPGFVNVDRFPPADVVHDLEAMPWPWPDSSVDEIRAHHILEHLGRTPEEFIAVMREMYRVARPGATVNIVFPWPYHQNYLTDPTHVRALMPETFLLFSRAFNRQCAEGHASDTPLGLQYGVDFEFVGAAEMRLDKRWEWISRRDHWKKAEMLDYARRHVGIIQEVALTLRVVK